MSAAVNVVRDGCLHSSNDDGAIHRHKLGDVDTLASTAFDSKDRSASMRVTGTVAGSLPRDVNWLEFSLTEYGAKRSKHAGISLNLAQVKRLRDLCNIVLGEES